MARTNGRTRPILVIDDDDDLCAVVVRALDPLGHEVERAATAADGLSAARARRPAVVVLDVRLPDLSGYEVCRELRDEFGEDLPIVFVSGCRTEDIDRAAGLIVGADDYVVKPFAVGDLIARVRRAIDRSSRHEDEDGGLTEREREVLGLLADGLSQKAIAERLFIAPKTVATHIQRILAKLGVHSRAEAVAFAHRHGLGRGYETGVTGANGSV